MGNQESDSYDARVEARITKAMVKKLHIHLDSGRFPYTTFSEMVRHGIELLLVHLDSVKGVTTYKEIAKVGYESANGTEFVRRMNADLQALESLVKSLSHSDVGTSEARHIVMQSVSRAEGIRGKAWRELYLRELHNRFGKLIFDQTITPVVASLKPKDFIEDESE